MPDVVPFHREAGQGPTVFCLHANASHSGQWKGLMDQLADRFRVVAIDCYGCGKTAEWTSDRLIQLHDEVRLCEPLLAAGGYPAYLVGHSYGAAVALKAALLRPHRFAGLALYEPTLFTLVDQHCPPPNGADGIRQVVAMAGSLLDRGDTDGAARVFIDFWMGDGSWDTMPADRKPAIAAAVTKIRRWSHALFTEPVALADFKTLNVPVLYMTGGRSPESSRSVAALLVATLPYVRHVEFLALGHMAPVTHPDMVNAEIERFLRATLDA